MGLRLKVGAFTVVALFSLLVVRLYSLQIVHGSSLNSAARQIAVKDVEVPAMRGEILARGGGPANVLAGNKSEWIITLSQQSAQNNPQVIGSLAALVPTATVSSINAALASKQYALYQPIPVANNVPSSTVLYIQENPKLFPGVNATQSFERTYPQSSLAAQVLGYVGDINAQELQSLQGGGYNSQSQIGQSGLEAQYESQLHGVPGIQQVEVDPSGYAVSTASNTPAIPGDNLYLNMDLGLEQVTSSSLANQIQRLRSPTTPSDFGAAVVLDIHSGAVLAMSSFPSYNNNVWVPGISQTDYNTLVGEYGRPLNNYAIAGSETPGSTFKLVTATAALDDGLISGSTYYDDTGTFTIGQGPQKITLADSESSALGEINVSTALGASVDTFFYNLGALFCQQNVGCPTQIQQYAAKYGLGQDPMIDLPNVASGQVDGPQLRVQLHQQDPAFYPTTAYYQGENVETAFGQGKTLVTPLQLADAYATFANGGTRYAPQMAAGLVSPSGKVTRIAPKVLGHVNLPASTYQPILQGLEETTQSTLGTASAAFAGFDFTKWNIAGKTGTATAATNQAPVSWFVAFGGPRNAPPKYAVVVEIDKGGYGAAASAPVVRQIFNYLYQHGISQLKLPK